LLRIFWMRTDGVLFVVVRADRSVVASFRTMLVVVRIPVVVVVRDDGVCLYH
jgi:hypothetical protein